MRWPEALRPHRDPWSVFGYLVAARVGWSILARMADAMDVAELATEYGPKVWSFFDTLPGTMALLVIAVVSIAYANRRYGGSAIRPEPRGERTRQQREDAILASELRGLLQTEQESKIIILYWHFADGNGVQWEGIKEEGNPHISFHLPVVNASLYSLDRGPVQCTGMVRFESEDLRDLKVELLPEKRDKPRVDRGAYATLVLTQPLLPDIVTRIRGKATQKVTFSFSQVAIRVNASASKGGNTKNWIFHLTQHSNWNGECRATVPGLQYLSRN